MSKDDGNLHLHGEITPLMRLLLKRRSFRAYAEGRPTGVQADHVLQVARTFVDRAGFHAPRLAVVDDDALFQAVVRAAMQGVVGKINPWLAFTKARVMLLCGAVYPPDRESAGVERAIKEASMAMQVAVLAATEVGLATCWMAGIHHEAIEAVHPMPDGAHLVAISPLGLPPASRNLSWDAVANYFVSSRRKPLDELWMAEEWRRG